MFPKEFYTYLTGNTLIEIKGGTNRSDYIPIWMVEVEKRIFARSWNRSIKSWFTEFQKTGVGEIKYGENIIKVKGKKVSSEDPINHKISEAYILNYDQPQNLKYTKGISQPEYFNFTMEFFFDHSV